MAQAFQWGRRPRLPFGAALIVMVLAGACAAATVWPLVIAPAEYAARRAQLMAAHPDALIVIHARDEAPPYAEGGFRQDKNFYYLTGRDDFGAVLVLDAPNKQSWLFLPKTAMAAAASASQPADGELKFAATDELVPLIRRRVKEGVKKLYDTYAGPERAPRLPPDESGSKQRDRLAREFPKVKWESLRAELVEMRWVKSPAEVDAMRRVGWSTAAAMRAAIRDIAPGRSQRDIEGQVIASCIQNGSEGQSFWPWVMSGANSVYPAPARGWYDYTFLNRTMQAGELVWLDLGCAREHYEGDIGRTVPVSGKWTPEQREVWDLLNNAFQAARAAIRPGATIADAKRAYYGSLRAATGTAKTELARQAIALEMKEAEANEEIIVHGVGLGPVERPFEQFRPGVVVAIEPRIVIPERKMGFILEDMVVVNDTGNELLSAGLPYTAEEVEQFMATRARSDYTTIDAHDHYDPGPHTADGLVHIMNVLGMSKSVIFGGTIADHEYVQKAAAQYPDRLIPFYRASVREEQDAWLANDPKILAELERQLSSGRWKGIGEFSNVHYPPGKKARMGEALLETEVSPLAPLVIAMFQLAEKYNLPVLIHNEVYYYKELDELLTRFPKVTVIWAHAGYVSYYGVDMAMKKHPNLYADLSIRALYRLRDSREASIFHDETLLKPEWKELIERYPDRFMAGLDEYSKAYNGHEAYFEGMAKLLNQLTPATARKVACENIERILATAGK